MKYLILALAIAAITVPSLNAQERKEQYGDIKPKFKCHFSRDRNKICRALPNLSRKLNLCNPDPEIIGTIEWCRKEYTKTDIDECGNPVTYEAVDVTYRYVYCNGGWGTCFTRTYQLTPVIVEPPILAKGVIK